MKTKSFLLIIGAILTAALSAIATYFGLSSSGIIKGDRINLVYSIDDYNAEYSGNVIYADEDLFPYELIEGRLLEGHKEEFVYTGNGLDVGETKVSAAVKIYDKDGYDVSSEYKIKVNTAKLRIYKREVVLAVDSTKISFSGQNVEAKSDALVVISGSLANGDKVVPTISFNSDNTKLVVNANIYDVFGSSKTSNYEIKYDQNDNSVGITKLPLLIEPVSVSKVYDGEPLTFSEYRIKNGVLLSNHHLEVGFPDGITNVNESGTNFKIKSAFVYDEDGNNVSDMYDIDISTKASITIKSLAIPIKINHIEKSYDGAGFDENSIPVDLLYTCELPDLLKDNNYSVKMTNYETIKNLLTSACNVNSADLPCQFTLMKGNQTINSNNYTFDIIKNTYEITPCVVHVLFKDLGKYEYNGKTPDIKSPYDIVENFYIDSNSTESANDEFMNMELVFENEYSAIEYFKKDDFKMIGTHFYNVKLALKDINSSNDSGDNVKYSNFKIVYENRGRFEVTKIKLTIYGLSKTYEYNGKNQYIKVEKGEQSYKSVIGDILEGDIITVSYSDSDSIKDVGEKSTSKGGYSYSIKRGSQEVSADYYEVDFIPGTLTITPKELIVKYKDKDKEIIQIPYGTEINIKDEKYRPQSVTGFVNGESITQRYYDVNSNYKQYDPVGDDYYIRYSNFTSTLASDKEILKNYKVTCIDLQLKVTPKVVSLTWDNYENLVYNGKVQIPTCSLGNIETFDKVDVGVIVKADLNDKENIESINANEVTKPYYYAIANYLTDRNYALPEGDESYIEFSIKKATLRIVANDSECTYGDNLDSLDLSYHYEGFMGNDNFTVVKNTSFISVTVDKFVDDNPFLDRKIIVAQDPNAKVYADNYEIEFVNGILHTNRPIIEVSFSNNLKMSYGSDLKNEIIGWINNNSSNNNVRFTGFIGNDSSDDISIKKLSVESIYTIGSKIGLYDFTINGLSIEKDGIQFYEFKYNTYEVEVTKRDIQVSLSSAKDPAVSEITYNGKDLVFNSDDFIVDPYTPLAENDRVADVTIYDACVEKTRNISINIPIKIINALGVDVSDNYSYSQISYNINGINSRTLNFETVFLQFQYYDGLLEALQNPMYISGMTKLISELGSGDQLMSYQAIAGSGTKTGNIVTYDVVISEAIIYNAKGENITEDYYSLEAVIGIITIINCPDDLVLPQSNTL